jgi:hypothetical protein
LIGRVLDAQIQFTPIASRLFEQLKDGFHYATASDSVDSAASSTMGDSNAERMTAEVFWMTSKLSARSAALPW